DVVEWVPLHQDDVGPLARCERPRTVLNADGLRRHPRGGYEGFRWREAILREQFQLQGIRASQVQRRTTIRPHSNFDAHLMGATRAQSAVTTPAGAPGPSPQLLCRLHADYALLRSPGQCLRGALSAEPRQGPRDCLVDA